jgi:hypothetical protein
MRRAGSDYYPEEDYGNPQLAASQTSDRYEVRSSDAGGDSDVELASPTMQEAHENFKVVIRVRPPVRRETEDYRPFVNIVRVEKDHKQITLCEHLDTDDGRSGVYSSQAYSFDYVYDETAQQRDVYERSAQPAVASVLQGYNSTIMAYGQTGTGKTYTMEGFDQAAKRGIIPHATEAIFANIGRANKNLTFQVRASYLQIYNEQISDLLKPSSKALSIRQSNKRVFVDGLSEWVVRSPEEIYGLMERGTALRTTSATKMSELSSRSHAIFLVVIEILEGEPDAPTSFKFGKLNIVDLAGSEKVRATGVTGQQLKETQKINASLHQLGNVISALSDPKVRDKSHIPYRNSKLTHFLTDSLGGNCKTTLIACISPSADSYQESLSTLKFANRAKNILNIAVVNEDVDTRGLIEKYEKELKRLRSLVQEQAQGSVGFGSDPALRRAHDNAVGQLEERDREVGHHRQQQQELQSRVSELETMLVSTGVVGGGDVDRDEDMAQVERYKQLLLKQRDIMLNLTTRLNERDETILRLQEEIDAYDSHVQTLEDALDAQSPAKMSHAAASAHTAERRVVEHGAVRYEAEGGADAALLSADEKIVELLMMGAGQGGDAHAAVPTTDAALQSALVERTEAAALRLLDGRALKAQTDVSSLRTQLDAAEERNRHNEYARDQASPAAAAQGDRLRAYLQQETEAVRRPLVARLTDLEDQLQRERSDRRRAETEFDRVRFEVERLRQSRADSEDVQRVWRSVRSVEDNVARQALANMTAPATGAPVRHADPQQAPPAASSMRVMQLENAVETLKKQSAASAGELQAQLDERNARIRALEEDRVAAAGKDRELTSLRKSLATHTKDRTALKKIMESRIKSKVDGIAASVTQGRDRDSLGSEINSLQNLVNASINAMNADTQ